MKSWRRPHLEYAEVDAHNITFLGWEIKVAPFDLQKNISGA